MSLLRRLWDSYLDYAMYALAGMLGMLLGGWLMGVICQ